MNTSTLTLPSHKMMTSTKAQGPCGARPASLFTIRKIVSACTRVVEQAASRIAFPTLLGGLALIMIWFGAPKLIPGGSPAEAIAVHTIARLTGGLLAGDLARLILGILEVALGVAVLVPIVRRLALVALLGHMAATFTPLFLFPETTWHAPFVGSLEGQYILKNILVVGVIFVLLGFSRNTARSAR